MASSSYSLRMALGLTAVVAVGVAPFVFRALRASEPQLPTASISAASQEDEPAADSTNQLALAPPAQPGENAAPRVARQVEKQAPAQGKSNDPYAVPDGSIEDLIKFIGSVQKVKPQGQSKEAQLENSSRIANAVVGAAEKILASNPSDEEATAVVRVEFGALWHLVQIEDETAVPRIDALLASLKEDKRPEVMELVLENSIMRRIRDWDSPSAEEQAAFAADMKQLLTPGSLTEDKLKMAFGIAEMLESVDANQTAAAVYEAIIAALPQTEEAKEIITRMEGTIRRLQLPGKFMEVSGTLVDGKPFDWNAYRGKVVLIDFWATWCGPCIKELPNVLENYRKYHDKGFEVVGVSLDDDPALVKKFITDRKIPWPSLLEADPDKRGWNNPLTNYYGISGIPAAILVDQEGKVVSLAAYGDTLGEQLERLLGSTKKTDAQ